MQGELGSLGQRPVGMPRAGPSQPCGGPHSKQHLSLTLRLAWGPRFSTSVLVVDESAPKGGAEIGPAGCSEANWEAGMGLILGFPVMLPFLWVYFGAIVFKHILQFT